MRDLRDKIKYKLLATSIHMLLSLLIFAVVAYLIVFEWYPDGLFTADGGLTGLKLMAVIDLILGPSLTFIIYNHMKSRKEIFFDLSIIAIIQISALIWGGAQIYSQRPVALVMWENVFYAITEDYLFEQNLTAKDLSIYSDENPLIIYAKKGGALAQLKEVKRLNEKKIPPYAQVHLFKSIKDNIKAIEDKQLSDEYLVTRVSEYEAIGKYHVFAGTAKHGKILIFLDPEGNLLEVRAVSLR